MPKYTKILPAEKLLVDLIISTVLLLKKNVFWLIEIPVKTQLLLFDLRCFNDFYRISQ